MEEGYCVELFEQYFSYIMFSYIMAISFIGGGGYWM